MYVYKSRYSLLFKATGWVLVCLLLANDISWASPPDPNPPQSAIAAQSRFKPFFEKHGLEFQNISTVVFVTSELKNLLATKKAREGRIYARIRSLNQLFPDGNVEIEPKIKEASFKCSGKGFKYAVMHFKKEKKTFNILFLEDHAALTAAELSELRIEDRDRCHLDCPGLEGVWFIDTVPLAPKPKAALEGTATATSTGKEPQSQEELVAKAATPAISPIPKNSLGRLRTIIYGIILAGLMSLAGAQVFGMFFREKESSLQHAIHLADSRSGYLAMTAVNNLRSEGAPEAADKLSKLAESLDRSAW